MLHAEKLSQPMIRTDVYLLPSQRDAMKKLGRQQDISMAELIRRVLNNYLRRAAKEPRAAAQSR
jgi:hypothetical protein